MTLTQLNDINDLCILNERKEYPSIMFCFRREEQGRLGATDQGNSTDVVHLAFVTSVPCSRFATSNTDR